MQIPPVFKTGDLLKDVKFMCNFLRQYKKGLILLISVIDTVTRDAGLHIINYE